MRIGPVGQTARPQHFRFGGLPPQPEPQDEPGGQEQTDPQGDQRGGQQQVPAVASASRQPQGVRPADSTSWTPGGSGPTPPASAQQLPALLGQLVVFAHPPRGGLLLVGGQVLVLLQAVEEG